MKLFLALHAAAVVVNPRFSFSPGIFPVGTGDTSNAPGVLEAQGAVNVDVKQGVIYPLFTISADSGLGTNSATIEVKLALYDTVMCTDASVARLNPEMDAAPFNGATNTVSSASTTSNAFQNVVFSKGGVFRLCYTRDNITNHWELLPITITVLGTLHNKFKFWCVSSLMTQERCLPDYSLPGCLCKGQVKGKRRADTGEVVPLGVQVPTEEQFTLGIVTEGVSCGTETLQLVFNNKKSVVEFKSGSEVHDMGNLRSNLDYALWEICYCVAFDANKNTPVSADNGPCHQESFADFPAHIGKLIITSILTQTKSGANARDVAVYPSLSFNLVLQCGTDGKVLDLKGGCNPTAEVRYKIIAHMPQNDLLYFDSASGCRAMNEAATERAGVVVLGGHLGPDNCDGTPTTCVHAPTPSAKAPIWENVQVDVSYINDEMAIRDFDVCYCDGNCRSSANWFRVGDFMQYTIQSTFENRLTVNSETVSAEPVVNTDVYVQIKGRDDPGAWSTAGSTTREMKILADPDAAVGKLECQSEVQSDFVSGHVQSSGNLYDYAEPSELIGTDTAVKGHLYGKTSDTPTIKVGSPGWIAVCYCDRECNVNANWLVTGRLLVAGPLLDQTWVRSTNIRFNLEIEGYGLKKENKILILDAENEMADCGDALPSQYVFGLSATEATDNAVVLEGGTGSILEFRRHEYGTEIVFQGVHGLKTKDQILLMDVRIDETPDASDKLGLARVAQLTRMYNKVHNVQFLEDNVETTDHRILIPVHFTSAEFPTFIVTNASWRRNSHQMFKGMSATKASPEGRGYVVCWSPGAISDHTAFVGQAGKLTVKDPPAMVATLSLVTADASRTDIADKAERLAAAPPKVLGDETEMQTDIDAGNADRDVIAPFIVTFRTSESLRYKEAAESMQLKLVFNKGKVENGGNTYWEKALEPRQADGTMIAEESEYSSPETAKQHMCGKYFLELWGKENPFPQPKGCYANEDDTNPNIPVWEVFIVFNAGNHLAPNSEYQIVMNGKYYLSMSQENFPAAGPVSVYSLDDYINRPYEVVDRGDAQLIEDIERSPLLRDARFSTLKHAALDEDEGFFVLGDDADEAAPTNSLRTLKRYCLKSTDDAATPAAEKGCQECDREEDCGNGSVDPIVAPNANIVWCIAQIDINCPNPEPSFRFQLKSHNTALKEIGSGFNLRLFMFPLTQWNLPNGCTTAVDLNTCVPKSGSNGCDQPLCDVESVVGGKVTQTTDYQINVIKIKLPTNVENIDRQSTSNNPPHFPIFHVSAISLPRGGFFPTRFSAEISVQEKEGSFYFSQLGKTEGAMVWVKPIIKVASLVNRLGDGNAKPYIGDTANILYLKFISGATITTTGATLTKIEIMLPDGYGCDTIEGLNVPRTLGIFDDAVPSGRGPLGVDRNVEIAWTVPASNARICLLTLATNMIVYADAPIFVGLRVTNPNIPLKQFATNNQWIMDVKVNTDGNAVQLLTKMLEGDDGVGDFAPSVSVMGKLTREVVQPSNFGLGEKNTLYVFFRTQQEAGSQSFIKEAQIYLEAAAGFNFKLYCEVNHLEDSYYVPEPEVQTRRLPIEGDIIPCKGEPISSEDVVYNRAIISTHSRLSPLTLYGFKIAVINADYSALNSVWRIFTYESTGAASDGSFHPVRNNEREPEGAASSKSFALYQRPTPLFSVSMLDARPLAQLGAPTIITVFPISVPARTIKNVRVNAPAGFRWLFKQSDFAYQTMVSNPNKYVEGVEADMPISLIPSQPIVEPLNELRIDYMNNYWLPGLKYGFRTLIAIPELTPTGAKNYFTIEFGYDEARLENRVAAGTATTQSVRKLINAGIDYTSSTIGTPNTITFFVETITDIPRGGALVVTGPPNFKFAEACYPKPVLGAPELPYDATCIAKIVQKEGGGSKSQIAIVAGEHPIKADLYKFSLPTVNPQNTAILDEEVGEWEFKAYKLQSKEEFLDFSSTVPGFKIYRPMQSLAFIVPATKAQCRWDMDPDDETNLIPSCPFRDWQYHAPRGFRNDRPGMYNHVIIAFTLRCSTNIGGLDEETLCNTPDDPIVMRVKAPWGFVFNNECVAVVDSKILFDDTNTRDDAVLPDEFATDFTSWPASSTVQSCTGKDNIAELRLSKGLLSGIETQEQITGQTTKKDMPYLFRIETRNPLSTPLENNWVIEFNNEASQPFRSFDIWTFAEAAVIPLDSAASLKTFSTISTVTIQMRSWNGMPPYATMRVFAPLGFIISFTCFSAARVNEDELATYKASINDDPTLDANEKRAALNAAVLWSDFNILSNGDPVMVCRGEEKASNKATISIQGGRFLREKMLYYIELEVENPRSTSQEAEDWYVEIWERNSGTSMSELGDLGLIPGFAVNSLAHSFTYQMPSRLNADEQMMLQFDMSFSAKVEMGDNVKLVFPLGYVLNEEGSNLCTGYVHMYGPLRRTIPVCGANMLTYHVVDDFIHRETHVGFQIRTTNPSTSPYDNVFKLRHLREETMLISSRVIDGYHIYPRLLNVEIVTVSGSICDPGGDSRPSKSDCRAEGSLNPIEVIFVPQTAFNYIDITGTIEDLSFDFTTITEGKVEIYDTTIDMSLYEALVSDAATGDGDGDGDTDTDTDDGGDTGDTASDADSDLPPLFYEQEFTFVERTKTNVALRFIGNVVQPQGVRVLVRLRGVLNPKHAAVSHWHVVTSLWEKTEEAHTLTMTDAESGTGFRVLTLIEVLLGSTVIPPLYTQKNAIIRFGIRFSNKIMAGTLIMITRPPGEEERQMYKFINGTLTTSNLPMRIHGADDFFTDPSKSPLKYYMITAEDMIDEETQMEIRCDLPLVPYKDRVWLFDTYTFDKVYDEDGEEVEQSPPQYPEFISRVKSHHGTSDSLFDGFDLIGEIPFQLFPQIKTPGALISLRLTFTLDAPVESEDKLRVEVVAPTGYIFAAGCFAKTTTQTLFNKCTGNQDLAVLKSSGTVLEGTDIPIFLSVRNTNSKPVYNVWRMYLYRGQDQNHANYSSEPGYDVMPMGCKYKGNNQLGYGTSGYFMCTPTRSMGKKGKIEIFPPPGANYHLACAGVKRVGLPEQPSCTQGDDDEPLVLELSEFGLDDFVEYTFGIGVTNPPEPISEEKNLWGVMIKNFDGETVDANMMIPGLKLEKLDLMVEGMGWGSAAGDYLEATQLGRIMIKIVVVRTIPKNTITEMKIISPQGTMFADPKNTVTVSEELKTAAMQPIKISGNILTIVLDTKAPIENNELQIIFEVKNPSSVADDNTWKFEGWKNDKVIFTHVLEGYLYNQASKYSVQPPEQKSGAYGTQTPRGIWHILSLVWWSLLLI